MTRSGDPRRQAERRPWDSCPPRARLPDVPESNPGGHARESGRLRETEDKVKDEEIDALALAVANELREQHRRETRRQQVGALTPDQAVEVQSVEGFRRTSAR